MFAFKSPPLPVTLSAPHTSLTPSSSHSHKAHESLKTRIYFAPCHAPPAPLEAPARPAPAGAAWARLHPQSADSSAVRQKFELSGKKDLFPHLPGHIHLSAARYQVQSGFHVTLPTLWRSRGSSDAGSGCHTLVISVPPNSQQSWWLHPEVSHSGGSISSSKV